MKQMFHSYLVAVQVSQYCLADTDYGTVIIVIPFPYLYPFK